MTGTGSQDLPWTLRLTRAHRRAYNLIPVRQPHTESVDLEVVHVTPGAVATLRGVLAMVAEFRKQDATTPVVLMGYGNPIEAMGWEAFAARCAEVGVDGVLTVDFPPEESHAAFEQIGRAHV